MAHEITKNDGLMLTQKPAWHGLGVLVEQAPTCREALRIARLDWTVELHDLHRSDGAPVTTHRASVRTDTGETLGIVGCDWTPVQNWQLADLAESLNQDGIVRVETAGSLQGGKKVWFLLRGETIERKGAPEADRTVPYILLANGHDGGMTLSARGTSVRVVCANTLGFAMSGTKAAVAFRHTSGISQRMDEAKALIQDWLTGRDLLAKQIDALGQQQLTNLEVQEFFLAVYTRTLGCQIPSAQAAALDPRRQATRTAAMDRISRWQTLHDLEIERTGGRSLWSAFNAVTGELPENERALDKGAELFGGPELRRRQVFAAALAEVRS